MKKFLIAVLLLVIVTKSEAGFRCTVGGDTGKLNQEPHYFKNKKIQIFLHLNRKCVTHSLNYLKYWYSYLSKELVS